MTENTEKQAKFELLAELLLAENEKYNLTRIVDPAQVKVRHFQDSLIIADKLTAYAADCDYTPRLIDIGSGAGFPSLALAIVLDDWRFVSVEATGKKAAFQNMAAEQLGLTNFTATNARAEDLGQDRNFRANFDIATARALGHMAMIAELALPLIRTGGRFFAWKGPKYSEELGVCGKLIAKLGGDRPEIFPYSLPGEDNKFYILETEKIEPTPTTYPRQFNIIKRSVEKLTSAR